MTEQQLLDEQRADQQRRAGAAAELAASRAEPDELRVSSDALEMLCELLSLAMAGRDSPEEAGTATEPVHGLRLTVRHDSARTTRITGTTGELVLEDTVVELDVTAGYEHPAEGGGTSDRISGAAR